MSRNVATIVTYGCGRIIGVNGAGCGRLYGLVILLLIPYTKREDSMSKTLTTIQTLLQPTKKKQKKIAACLAPIVQPITA